MLENKKLLNSITNSLIGMLALTTIASAETGVRDSPEMVVKGARLYDQFCSACHLKDGIGEPPIPRSIRKPDYITAMPLDETSHAWHHGDEQLIQIILKGTKRSRTRMPALEGILSEEQVRDLIAYMKSLWSDRILACQGPKHMSCM